LDDELHGFGFARRTPLLPHAVSGVSRTSALFFTVPKPQYAHDSTEDGHRDKSLILADQGQSSHVHAKRSQAFDKSDHAISGGMWLRVHVPFVPLRI
jgi:hypothetical protein